MNENIVTNRNSESIVSESETEVSKKQSQNRPKIGRPKKIISTPNQLKTRPITARRVPLKDQSKIYIDQDPNYHYRLVNDVGDRLKRFETAGYTFVYHNNMVDENDMDNRRSKDESQMGTKYSFYVGNGTTAYYMRIPLALWESDQSDKQLENDRIENQLRPPKNISENQPFYGKMKISSNFNELDEE